MRARWMVGTMAVAALALVGCGSSGKGNVSAGTTVGGSATTSSSGSDGSTVDTNFSGKGSKDFCNKAKDLAKNPAFSGNTSTENAGDLKKNFGDLGNALDDLKSSAPSEIKSDIESFSNAFNDIKSTFDKYDYDFTKIAQAAAQDPTIQQKLESFSTDVSQSGARIEAYFEQVCGIQSPSTT